MNGFTKITEEIFYGENEAFYDKLPEIVKTNIHGNTCDFQYGQELSLIDCESPIEQLLSIEINRINLLTIHRYNPAINVIDFEIQKEVCVNGAKYRADFYLEVAYYSRALVKFVIECDGFDYHSSREQMKRDYERTRVIQSAGYEVIKFTGREIYNGPYQCALEVLSAVVRKAQAFSGDNDA